MSDEQKLDDEAPPEIPDISSSPPPPPSEGVGDELEDDIEMDEHDDEDVAVEDEEVSVAGDDEEEIEPEPISSAPPPKRRRERAQTAPHTPVARASVQPPAGDDQDTGMGPQRFCDLEQTPGTRHVRDAAQCRGRIFSSSALGGTGDDPGRGKPEQRPPAQAL